MVELPARNESQPTPLQVWHGSAIGLSLLLQVRGHAAVMLHGLLIAEFLDRIARGLVVGNSVQQEEETDEAVGQARGGLRGANKH